MQEDFFNNIYVPLTLWQGFEKGYTRVACERQLEIEHNFNILTPNLWPSTLCLSRSSYAQPEVQRPTLLGDGFLYCILSASSLDPNSSGPQALSAWCGFPYHNSSISISNCRQLNWPLTSVLTALYNNSIANSIFEIECLIVIKWK